MHPRHLAQAPCAAQKPLVTTPTDLTGASAKLAMSESICNQRQANVATSTSASAQILADQIASASIPMAPSSVFATMASFQTTRTRPAAANRLVKASIVANMPPASRTARRPPAFVSPDLPLTRTTLNSAVSISTSATLIMAPADCVASERSAPMCQAPTGVPVLQATRATPIAIARI